MADDFRLTGHDNHGGAPPNPGQPEIAVRAGAPGTPADVIPAARGARPRTPENTPERPPEIKDPIREIVETVVFVVVLVFMLKTFLAEAFVIPTGSMATTLLGYHRDIVCQKCSYEYRVNASSEAEPQEGRMREDVLTADCPNCAYRNTIQGRLAGGR